MELFGKDCFAEEWQDWLRFSDVKPGFMILFYPVISADPDKRHKGTFVQLLGAEDMSGS